MKIALGILIYLASILIFSVLFIVLAPDFVHEIMDRIHGNSDKRPEDTAPRFSGKINRYSVGNIDFSPDGKFIAVASELGIELYSIQITRPLFAGENPVQTYNKAAFFEDKNHQGYIVMFSPDGQMLASTNDVYQNGIPIIKLWSVVEELEIATFKLRDASWFTEDEEEDEEEVGSFAITFSPDSQLLAMAFGGNRTIVLWSIAEKRKTATFKNEASVFDLAFSPDGQTLAVGSSDDTIRLWSISERREFAKFGESFSRKGYTGRMAIGVFSVRFSPDGLMLAGEGDGGISLWSFPEGNELLSLGVGMPPMSMGWLWSIAFSPDMKMLASGHYDGTIRLWAIPEKHEITPELTQELEQGTAIDPLKITSLKEDQSGVNCLAFSPDGRTLISGHESGTVQIWNIPTTYQILLQTGKSEPLK